MDEDIGHVLSRIMANLLIAAYGSAWAVAIIWPSNGLKFLLTASTVLTLPYFGTTFFMGLFSGIAIFTLLAALTVAFPPLGVIAIVLGVMLNAAKFGGCLMNIPVMLAGCGLYGLLALPHKIGMLISRNDVEVLPTTVIAAVAAGIGLCTILGVLRLFERFEYPRAAVAAMLLGFSWYVLMFVVSLIVPFIAHHAGLAGGSDGSEPID
jgi:hypothetical protein